MFLAHGQPSGSGSSKQMSIRNTHGVKILEEKTQRIPTVEIPGGNLSLPHRGLGAGRRGEGALMKLWAPPPAHEFHAKLPAPCRARACGLRSSSQTGTSCRCPTPARSSATTRCASRSLCPAPQMPEGQKLGKGRGEPK